MDNEKYGLKIVSLNDKSGIPFGMHEGIIITSTYPVMEAAVFKMVVKNEIYCTDEYFIVHNDAILRHSSCSADLLNYLSKLSMQYFDVDYDELAITDDLVKCFDILDEGLSYKREKLIKQLELKRNNKKSKLKKEE